MGLMHACRPPGAGNEATVFILKEKPVCRLVELERGAIFMKKALSTILGVALVLMLAMALVLPVGAVPGEQNGNSLSIVQPAGGAYVIVTKLAPGVLDFKYGWNNSKAFECPPQGYWIGVYDHTVLSYVWAVDIPLVEPNIKMLKLESEDETELVSGHEYTINFFVRCDYSVIPHINTAVIILEFVAP